jgi:hypothetical protein
MRGAWASLERLGVSGERDSEALSCTSIRQKLPNQALRLLRERARSYAAFNLSGEAWAM